MRTITTKSSIDFLNTRFLFITKHTTEIEEGYPLRLLEFPNKEILAVTFVTKKITKPLSQLTEIEAFLYAGVTVETAKQMLTNTGFIKPHNYVDILYLTRLDHPCGMGEVSLAYVDSKGVRIC